MLKPLDRFEDLGKITPNSDVGSAEVENITLLHSQPDGRAEEMYIWLSR